VTTAHLIALSEEAYNRLRTRLEGLSDGEYLWEPAPLAWSVRATPAGLRFDFGLLPVAPAPITTIAWRLTHIIDLLREDRCPRVLGVEPEADIDEVWITASAAEAIVLLERSFTTWRGYLEATDPDHLLDASDGWPDRLTFALHIIDELIHHAAEIGLLRDLYRAARTSDEVLVDVLGGDTSRVDDLRTRRPAIVADLASAGLWDAATQLIDLGFDVNPDGVVASPLHHAAGLGRIDFVRTLVEHGARTDAVDTIYKVPALVWAQTMSARMGGPNALGSDYDAVIEYLGERLGVGPR
jgi:hypothetical protein